MKSSMRLSVPPVGWLIVITLPLTGCAHVYKMQVDGAARSGTAPISYVIHEAGLVETPAADQTVAANYVRTALSAKGMFEAPNPETADMDVTYSYEIKKQRRGIEWDEPTYRTQHGVRRRERVEAGQDSNGNPIYITTTVEDPPPETVVDYIHHSADEIVYEKELHLVATERKPATPDTPARVWDISIVYHDEDPNMSKAMPLLAAAACDRIGTNTNGPVVVRLRDKDEVVAFIKRGL